MINIYIVDKSAESRNHIFGKVSDLLNLESFRSNLIPHVNIRQLSLTDLKFQAEPNICILGEHISANDHGYIKSIRKLFRNSLIFASAKEDNIDLEFIENLKVLEVDDILTEKITPLEFIKKILLSKTKTESVEGKIIVIDSGKGGAGVTSFTAGFAETLSLYDKKTVMIDLDFESQDLSRFCQIRPFLNENLSLLLSQNRAFVDENIQQCVTQVDSFNENLFFVTTPYSDESIYNINYNESRLLIRFIEVLKKTYDYVIIDSGSIRSKLREKVCQIADKLLLILNNDPASAFATIEKLKNIRLVNSSPEFIRLIENKSINTFFSNKYIIETLVNELNLPIEIISEISLPFCRKSMNWPGSTCTMRDLGSLKVKSSFNKIVGQIIEEFNQDSLPNSQENFEHENVKLIESRFLKPKVSVSTFNKISFFNKFLKKPKYKREVQLTRISEENLPTLIPTKSMTNQGLNGNSNSFVSGVKVLKRVSN